MGAELPAWPFYLLVAGFPVWWVLGFGAFAVAMVAVPMVVLLVMRRTVRVPPAFALWVLFVVWAAAAAIELDSALRLVGFAVRLANYIGAGVVFLYVYNCSERRLPRRSALLAVAGFFAFVVVGGWLGVLIPHGHLTTPAENLLPGSIASNEYVHDLVHPPFAEVQRPYGSPRTFTRPSAPFAYTNGWGCNVALLVPLACAALSATRRARDRALIAGVLCAAVVPAVFTLNRGMYIALGFGLAYAAVRLAWRGHVVPLMGIMTAGVVGAFVASAAGVVSSLNERLHYSETNTGRAQVYREAFDGAVASPLLGNGAPRPSQTLDISIGTQGQVWNVMFSYGFPALFCFIAWLVAAALVSSRRRGVDHVWLHVVPVVALLTIVYYGYDGPQLMLVMVAAALGMRAPDREPAVPALPVAAPVPSLA
ncbi:hypothetical protein CLV35_3123 [Motilibacter peucedani]|uniref:O-antigen ligase-like membrane protein n=1 Tax=Motilibacter peucedani TaxID=598650 RepID=A0A420XLD6_9ACTN|nr:hypothetical protein CLV35_3123 [Motilibacter peucedani]